jgi:hypothetical protein
MASATAHRARLRLGAVDGPAMAVCASTHCQGWMRIRAAQGSKVSGCR